MFDLNHVNLGCLQSLKRIKRKKKKEEGKLSMLCKCCWALLNSCICEKAGSKPAVAEVTTSEHCKQEGKITKPNVMMSVNGGGVSVALGRASG